MVHAASATRLPAHVDTLRFQQPESCIRSDGKSMHVEIGFQAIVRSHDRRWRGYDLEAATLPDPIDMPMTVHDHGVIGEVLQPTDEPTAIDESRPDPLGQCLRPAGDIR